MTKTPFLIFDAYGTLVELDNFFGRLQNGFAQHGLPLPVDVVKRAAYREMKHYIERSVQARDHESWLRLRLECAGVLADEVRAQGYQLTLSMEHTAQILSDAIRFRAFSETRAVLEALQRLHIPMGVLSNWDYELPHIFETIKLRKFFSFVLSSAEVGVPKPALETFQSAIRRAQTLCPGLKPQDCFYIGDHYEKDVLPARAAGLTPLWLVRNERDEVSAGADTHQDKVVRLNTLDELLRVLRLK